MSTARWRAKRKPYWDRLEELVARAGRRGLNVLSYRELQELGLLYRQAASDLSTVRHDAVDRLLAVRLNQLLATAHNLIYMGRRRRGGIWRFYRSEFPRVFRSTFNYTLAAFIIFLGAMVAGFLTCLGDPAFQRFFLGPAMTDTIERREMWTESVLAIKPLASSAIMTNNLSVSFTTFALGISGGVGTVFMLAFNGLLMGVVSAACWQAGLGLSLGSFVAAHGVLELPAIFIAGGAGLLIARGLLFPGALPRRDALVEYGGQAVRLALGIIPMLIIAGTLEGFVSPSHIAVSIKFAIAAALFSLLVLYLSRAGADSSGK